MFDQDLEKSRVFGCVLSRTKYFNGDFGRLRHKNIKFSSYTFFFYREETGSGNNFCILSAKHLCVMKISRNLIFFPFPFFLYSCFFFSLKHDHHVRMDVDHQVEKFLMNLFISFFFAKKFDVFFFAVYDNKKMWFLSQSLALSGCHLPHVYIKCSLKIFSACSCAQKNMKYSHDFANNNDLKHQWVNLSKLIT